MPQSKGVAQSTSCPLPRTATAAQRRRRTSLPHMSKPLPPTPPQESLPDPRDTPSTRPRPTFHISVDTSDPEEPLNPVSTDSSDPDTRPLLRNPSIADRESARRFHALSELLSTELGYLLDLRTLVSVYLRLLPVLKNRSPLPPAQTSSNLTVSYFSRPPSLHASLRTHSHPHLDAATYVLTVTHPDESHPPSSHSGLEKCTTRHLFSASDLDTITRNAEDILQLHERLVEQLRRVVSPFGISMTPSDVFAENNAECHHNSPADVHRAINAVSTVFVDYASNFDQYQSFCSGHSEAFDLVRKVQHRYTAEWDAFELRCATISVEVQSQDVSEELASSESRRQFLDLYKRRHSFSSLGAISADNPKGPSLSTSESGHADRDVGTRKPRLVFMDYMIKPVQRVCRYPLLFDQLQERTGSQRPHDSTFPPGSTRDAVQTALWTMRTVARLVDEARRQQDLIAKSVQIVSRITQGLLTSVSSQHRHSQSSVLSSFLSSLGPCYLSGSLDVIHYRDTNMARLGTVRAKYLGAFLFPGGYIVLVKVAKSKSYEPKHWFNLRGFELVDSNLDDALLPSWFRLSSNAHLFEFAASCRREKDIWVDAIRRAVAEETEWGDEPPSSLRADTTVHPLDDMQFETITPLPTIQSIPELEDVESTVLNIGEHGLPPSLPQGASQIHLDVDNPSSNDVTVAPMVGPSRRSSIVALTVPLPESNSFHLVRSTAAAREQVDRGLLDVFSEKCLTARFHAHTHEEDLFETQNVTRHFSRSTSALTMASAMSVAAKNRLTKRESVFVPRRKSFIEVNGMLSDTEIYTTSARPVLQKSLKRKHPSKLKITKATTREGDEDRNEHPPDSPSPLSHCSSVSFATPVTPLAIPAALPAPPAKTDNLRLHAEISDVRQKDCVPKRSKSMIENVRGLFTPRSVSPTTALSREPSTRSSVSTSSLLKWWSRESLRRRVRSAPDVPMEELPSAFTTTSLHTEAALRPLLATTDRLYSQPDLHCLTDGSSTSTTDLGVDNLLRQRGKPYSRGPQRRWTAFALSSEVGEDLTQVPRRSRRNFAFLQRFTSTFNTQEYDGTTPHES